MSKFVSKSIVLSLLTLSVLSGCTKEDVEGLQDDTIGLSQADFTLTNAKQEIQITTKGQKWVFSSYRTVEGVKDLNWESVSFSDTWFEVKKIAPNQIHIAVEANSSNRLRTLQITLSDRNYAGYINIQQTSPE